jgi:hypothetical protein
MWFLTISQFAIAAARSGASVFLLRAVFVGTAATTPHATGRLAAVGLDMDKLLTVLTLLKSVLVSLCPNFHCDMIEARELEYF